VPNIRWLLALITAVHRFVYHASGGRLGAKLGDKPMLLLENVGRKSGELRRTPLLYIEDAGRWIVVASNMGDPKPPAWWLNLQARPESRIRVGPAFHEVRARQAEPVEAADLWPKLDSYYPSYADYRAKVEREIPVVILEPRER
jgi:deazaflavin-dependent oxidoreductase (nitroreductase family)